MKTNLKIIGLSLIVMALWGSLFPMIKIGYSAFNINSSSIPDILMFAGARFIVCGFVVLLLGLSKRKKIGLPDKKSIGKILLVGLFAMVLHYSCTYIGLSTTDGSKTALIKQLGSLLYVCFSFLFIKSEKFSSLKIVGAILGFLGIVAINLNSTGLTFSVGDVLIIGASVCTVVSGILSKNVLTNNSPFWVTGISQFAGGLVLAMIALALGVNSLSLNLKSLLVFVYICFASTVGYLLWNYVLSIATLSKMFIIKFSEPLFACIFSAFLLGEEIFKIQYLLAFLLISIGIIMGNKGDEKNESSNK